MDATQLDTPAVGPATDRAPASARAFGSFLRHFYLPLGATYTTADGTGVALWTPPGRWKEPASVQLRLLPRLARAFGVRGLARANRTFGSMEERHPHEPHRLRDSAAK